MTPDVRTPTETDREQVVDVLRTSLNFPSTWVESRAPLMPMEDYRCVYEGDRILATAAEHRFRQWFGGRDLESSGVYGVATLPEHRATGLASAAVLRILDEARGRGASVTSLYPAVLRPYRKLGYELAGSFTEHRLKLDDIPEDLGGELPPVELFDVERDLDGIKACYRAWSRQHNGPVEPTDDRWWTRRVLAGWGDALFRAVVARGTSGGVEGFAAFRYVDTEGPLDVDFGLECMAFVAMTDRALRALLAYFRSFRGVGIWVQWTGPAEDPVALLLPEQTLTSPFRYRWMLRLLDVPAALAERGYPPIDAEAVVTVRDEQFPANDGAWHLAVRGGEATVERAKVGAFEPLPIGILSALFSGFLRVSDAVRLGYLSPQDPAVPALATMFAGADPWCPFFF